MADFKSWTYCAKNIANYILPPRPPHIQIECARENIDSAYSFCCEAEGVEYNPLSPELDKLAEWLTDNHHTGLLLYGQCGRGKTFFVKYVLPLILYGFDYPTPDFYTMTEAVRQTDKVLQSAWITLDDIGTEHNYNDYGTIRYTLDEVVDKAEKEGKMLFLTCNLTADELRQKYGERTFDRIKKLCTRILYTGSSYRQLPK